MEKFLEIKASSVNSLINNLERNGYLRRESISEDGRYKRLVLTDKAFAIREEIMQKVTTYMKSMFVGIAEDDLAVFERVILQMSKNTSQ